MSKSVLLTLFIKDCKSYITFWMLGRIRDKSKLSMKRAPNVWHRMVQFASQNCVGTDIYCTLISMKKVKHGKIRKYL